MSNVTTSTEAEEWMGNFKSTGSVIYNHNEEKPWIQDIYTELSDNFELNLTEKQLTTLNDLFNSGDQSNRIIAAQMFKYMLFKERDEQNSKA